MNTAANRVNAPVGTRGYHDRAGSRGLAVSEDPPLATNSSTSVEGRYLGGPLSQSRTVQTGIRGDVTIVRTPAREAAPSDQPYEEDHPLSPAVPRSTRSNPCYGGPSGRRQPRVEFRPRPLAGRRPRPTLAGWGEFRTLKPRDRAPRLPGAKYQALGMGRHDPTYGRLLRHHRDKVRINWNIRIRKGGNTSYEPFRWPSGHAPWRAVCEDTSAINKP